MSSHVSLLLGGSLVLEPCFVAALCLSFLICVRSWEYSIYSGLQIKLGKVLVMLWTGMGFCTLSPTVTVSLLGSGKWNDRQFRYGET